tara:strand:+ start:1018 stop:1248 length:231 start_codon:yes stop_codon:yes gene_type:complete
MENNINNIKELIASKKEKYPNVSTIWEKYLDQKIKLLQESLQKAENIFSNIEELSNQDVPYSTIALLYLINQEHLS